METILGISPLDTDSTACLVRDGQLLGAIAEERLSRIKQHRGFPYLAIDALLKEFNIQASEIDRVVYAFFDAAKEDSLKRTSCEKYFQIWNDYPVDDMYAKLKNLPHYLADGVELPGMSKDSLYAKKEWYKEAFYTLVSKSATFGKMLEKNLFPKWVKESHETHVKYFTGELIPGLEKLGLRDKLFTVEHHQAHAATAYYTSGFSETLIMTLDGYGSGLGGSVSLGKNGKIERLHNLDYPNSFGEFYAAVTSSLGFSPNRHAGKILGLAAYDSPDVLYDTVRSFFVVKDGCIHEHLPHSILYITRYLATKFPKPTMAAAYQKVLEVVVCEYISFYLKKHRIKNLVLSGGVFANVKLNQRLLALPDVENIFIHPNMGDGGNSYGAVLVYQSKKGITPSRLDNVYWGPEYSDAYVEEVLKESGVEYESFEYIEKEIAQLLDEGRIVARFAGRMEYGPRSLGNRSILYHGRDPSVNLWLNHQLSRTEFMPFAPATLFEQRDKCYKNTKGGEYTAEFMTLTVDCTEFMVKSCPAAVHVDGTARPQLVRAEANLSYYNIINEYFKITGIPSVINTSFNMHEEPIVCTPQDALNAFKRGNLDYLAIGPFLVWGPHTPKRVVK